MIGIRAKKAENRIAVSNAVAIVTAAIILLLCNSISADAATYTYTDDSGISWEYSYFDQMIQINGCDRIPASGELRIPAYIDGEPVQQVAYRAFFNNDDIKSIQFPDCMISIGDLAFCGCSISSLECPNSLARIGDQAFQNCTELTSVTFNDKLNTIGNNAFNSCTSLTDIHISENINVIEPFSFNKCTNLKNITVAPGNQSFVAVDNVLYSKNMETLVLYPPDRGGTCFSIPNGVTEIAAYSFNGAKMRSVTIPSTVRTLEDGAFYDCTNLSEVAFESGDEGGSLLESVGDYAFYGCDSLKIIDLPDNTKRIGENCFAYSEKLCVINLPDSVESIGANAFSGTLIDQNFKIPAGVSTIQKHTFGYCPGLLHLIIPDTVQYIEEGAFKDCNNLRDVYISSASTVIESGAFDSCGRYDSSLNRTTFALAGSEGATAAAYAEGAGLGFSVMTEAEYAEAIASDTPIYNFDDDQDNSESTNGDNSSNTVDSSNNQQSGGDSNTGKDNKTVTSTKDSGGGTISGTKTLPPNEKVKKSNKLGRPKFKAKNKKGKKIKLSWSKVKGAKGYILYVKGPKDKKFVRRVTMSAKVKSITHKGLIKGKKYKYKIAAYKVVKGVKVRGPFSKVIMVKVKK